MGGSLRRRIGLILGVMLVLSLGTIVTDRAGADPVESAVISIDAARHLPLGAVVTVEGIVTVPSGAFRSGMGDQGFGVQDRTGGLYVSLPVPVASLKPREPIRVTGRLTDHAGMLILASPILSPVVEPGYGRPVEPDRMATGLVGEASEGTIVLVEGEILRPVVPELPAGYRVVINDGSGDLQIFVFASTGIRLNAVRPGRKLRVVGFSAQATDHYEVFPRAQLDLRVSR